VEITIRQARAEDAKLIAWTMLMAGRSHMKIGIWDLTLSQPEEKCLAVLEQLTLQPPRHMCHYGEFLVAEVDGRPIAALEGFDHVTNGEITVAEPLDMATKKMGLTPEDMAPGQQALAAFFTCHSEYLDGAWVVEHVATLPEYRRIGAISRLLEAILEKGRRSGYEKAQVSFYIGNTPAESAYQKAGFRYLDEKRHPDFEALIGSPGMIRMVCKL
jgi:GNAT superfamily N-acetyltransferase